jgi:MFS superfamily sulfate permease-like transporter
LKSEVNTEAKEAPVNWGKELLASVVVFLVALPLCMGIAIASGVDPALGLISGIVGGLIVGPIAGSPLQVSGPAAGLVVLVVDLIGDYGIEALGLAVLIAGVLQAIAARLSLGRWFRATSPSVILGMLGGIGVLIFASQFHVMIDDVPRSSGLENLASIPEAIYKGIFPLDGSVHHLAAGIGLLTIASIVLWDRFKPDVLRAVPGALIGVVAGTVVAMIFALPLSLVNVPHSLMSEIRLPSIETLPLLGDISYVGAIIALAVIASAESLLSAAAVDKMHHGQRSDYNKELFAQGVGNVVCGVLGALPLTGVIVRSSANVTAGAKTRASAIFHGIWLLALVMFFPFILARIPTACLGAVLVFTGYKLLNPVNLVKTWKKDRAEFFILTTTITLIVVEDLLIGVAVGIALTAARLFWKMSRLHTAREMHPDGHPILHLAGTATFVTLPRLAEALEKMPRQGTVELRTPGLSFVDLACLEQITDWKSQVEGNGGTVIMSLDELTGRLNESPERRIQLHTGVQSIA